MTRGMLTHAGRPAMAPPQTDPNQGRTSSPKDLTHRVISGSVEKQTSPTARNSLIAASRQRQSPPLSTSQHNSIQHSANARQLPVRTPIASNTAQIQVLVHNPANNNDFVSRPSTVNILSRSPFFLTRIRAFRSVDMPVLHIIADLEYYDIVYNWLCTNNVRTREGNVPDLYTLIKVIFLADTFQLLQLSAQIVTMIKQEKYATSEVPRALPSYFEVYQQTTAGNPLRRFIVESYVDLEMGVAKPRVLLVDLPAAMLVDIIQLHEGERSGCSQKAFDERLAKAEDELKKELEIRFANREAELAKEYDERAVKVKEAMTHYFNTLASGGVRSLAIPRQQSAGTETIGSPLLEDIKKTYDKLVDEIEEKSQRHYNDLVEVMKQRNSEHLEAVQIMEKATRTKEARLMREIEALRKFKEEIVTAAHSPTDESSKSIAELRSIIKEGERTKNMLLQEIDFLKKENRKSQANAQFAESQRVQTLVKDREELVKANEELQEEAGRHYLELAELKSVHANSEEWSRRQLDSLHGKIDENARKYRGDIERLQATFKENSEAYKKELARLKKANKELLDQLTVGDDDDD